MPRAPLLIPLALTPMFDALRSWFLGLGAAHGVDPLVFGAIYVGAIPFFSLSLAWLVRRRGRSVARPASFFFVSAYLYLAVAVRNVPVWVWGVVAMLVGGGAVSAVRKVQARVAARPD